MGKIYNVMDLNEFININEFNRLTILGYSGRKTKQGNPYVLCDCKCGGKKEIQLRYVLDGRTKSCGCLRIDRAKRLNYFKNKKFDIIVKKRLDTLKKFCNGCGKEKPFDEFHINKNARDGVQTRCKDCVSVYYNKIRKQFIIRK